MDLRERSRGWPAATQRGLRAFERVLRRVDVRRVVFPVRRALLRRGEVRLVDTRFAAVLPVRRVFRRAAVRVVLDFVPVLAPVRERALDLRALVVRPLATFAFVRFELVFFAGASDTLTRLFFDARGLLPKSESISSTMREPERVVFDAPPLFPRCPLVVVLFFGMFPSLSGESDVQRGSHARAKTRVVASCGDIPAFTRRSRGEHGDVTSLDRVASAQITRAWSHHATRGARGSVARRASQ